MFSMKSASFFYFRTTMCCYYVRWMLSVWYMTWIPFFLSLVHLNSMSNRQSKMTDNLKNTFTGTLCYVFVCCKLKGHGHVDKDVWKKFGRVKGSWMHPYLMQICVLTTLLLRSFVTEDFVASFHPLSFPPPPPCPPHLQEGLASQVFWGDNTNELSEFWKP